MPADTSTNTSSNSARVLKTLLLVDLVDSTALVESLGDYRAAELFARCDSIARDLLAQHGGAEIDKTDGFLLIFDRPIDAVRYALKLHELLVGLSEESGTKLAGRAGIHLGEVLLRRNPPEHVARGAKPLEVEGLAKPTAARIMSLAQGGQTLITQAAFDLARRAAEDHPETARSIRWVNHGAYRFKGIDEPQTVYEVGLDGRSPLSPPPSSEKAQRVADHDQDDIAWRPSAGQNIPGLSGWKLERKLGEGSAGEVWLGRAKQIDTYAETVGLDASLGHSGKAQERAFLFYRAQGPAEGTDRAACWKLSRAVPCIVITSGDQRGTFVVLTKKPLVCGRVAAVELQVNDPKVSRKHFDVIFVETSYWIRELQSRNGVFVNGERIAGEQNLRSGDKITVGETNLIFYQAG